MDFDDNDDDDFQDDTSNDKEVIDSFYGANDFLNNSFDCEQISELAYLENDEAKFEKPKFKTLEHAFQASKTLVKSEQEEIINAVTAKAAKRLGKRCTLRPDWETKKLSIMDRLVRDKFSQHFSLKLKLLNLEGVKLIQGNSDGFWGVASDGEGENHLGKILMKVRNDYIQYEGSFKEQFGDFLRSNQLGFVLDMISFENE